MITICIPIWNKDQKTADLCHRAIESVKKYVRVPYTLVTVDNDSPVKDPRIPVTIQNPKNLGFGPAVNQGLKGANTPYVCQMNSDCELVEDSVSILIDFMQNHTVDISFPEHYENCRVYGLDKSDASMPDWRFGAFWIARADRFLGFDEAFEMCYWEDTDLWKRSELAGYRLQGYRGTWVKHVGGASSHPEIHRYFSENQRRYQGKYPE